MIRRVVFRPTAVRDLARIDRIVQARIDAALVRYATTGHGDVKSLKGRAGEFARAIDGVGISQWLGLRDEAHASAAFPGGLIAKGHPIGATGIAMIGWSALQLLGKAPPELQVKDPKLAATFNIGGPICASVCTVLRATR